MKLPGKYIVLFFLWCSFYATSQKQSLVFKTIDINDGLSQNSVVDIVEDIYGSEELPLVLTEGMITNNPIQSDNITHKNRLQLRYGENSLKLKFNVLDYVSQVIFQYQYKRENYNQEWKEAGNRKYVAYSNLPPEDYPLKIRVSEKISERAPLTDPTIPSDAPFWNEWWILVLVVIGMAALIYGLHRFRLYQLQEVQKVKNIISADLHDDLGSRLTNIHFLSTIFKQKVSLEEENLKYLKEIEDELEASAKSLDEIVWNINMKDESLDEIVAKMRKYALELLETGYDFHIKIEANFRKRKMCMQKRRELFLIFKELLNNIRKHAAATQVNIYIAIEDGMLLMEVIDNGCGFDPRKETPRNGIKNIKERLEKWDGKLNIRSVKNKGSTIRLKIPFDVRFGLV